MHTYIALHWEWFYLRKFYDNQTMYNANISELISYTLILCLINKCKNGHRLERIIIKKLGKKEKKMFRKYYLTFDIKFYLLLILNLHDI